MCVRFIVVASSFFFFFILAQFFICACHYLPLRRINDPGNFLAFFFSLNCITRCFFFVVAVTFETLQWIACNCLSPEMRKDKKEREQKECKWVNWVIQYAACCYIEWNTWYLEVKIKRENDMANHIIGTQD